MAKARFNLLALGARFRYEGGKDVWVKLSNAPEGQALIAMWQEDLALDGWIGQPVCCIGEHDPVVDYIAGGEA